MSKKSIALHREAVALEVIEDNPDASKEEMRAKFEAALGAVSIHKVKTFLDANKSFLNKQGFHAHDPTSNDGLTWEVVFTGKHKNGKIAAVRLELSEDDMKAMTDDELYSMFAKACFRIKEFKEGSGLEVGGLVV